MEYEFSHYFPECGDIDFTLQCNLAYRGLSYRGILQFFAPYKPTWHIGESYTFANRGRGIGFRFQYPKFPDMPSCTVLRNPFSISPQTIPDNNSRTQDELIELINDGYAKEIFEREELSTFWSLMKDSYPTLTTIVLRKLLPFATTYLCQSFFPLFYK